MRLHHKAPILAGLLLVLAAGCSQEIDVPQDEHSLDWYLEHSTNFNSPADFERCCVAAVEAKVDEPCVGVEFVDETPAELVRALAAVEPADASGDRLAPAVRQVLESALRCQLLRQQVIANNLANRSTVAFKYRRVVFSDLAPQELQPAGTRDSTGQYSPFGSEVGQGCQVTGTQTDFRQGTLKHTGRNLDVAIDGPGFFQVSDLDGTILYTRAGTMSMNANGNLVVGSSMMGRLLEPPIVVPTNAVDVAIDPEGSVTVLSPGDSQRCNIGQIQLANFQYCEGLRPMGENLYAQTCASGSPYITNPGMNGFGKLRQHTLEMSNVDADHELLELEDCTEQIRQLRRLLKLTGE